MNFVLATANQGKAKEINSLFGESCLVKTLSDIGFTEEIIEDGVTFAENAIIKATTVHNWLSAANLIESQYVLADDSGLVIDILNGEPGVHSARWLGADTPYDIKNNKILEMLANVPEEKRTARFMCVIACAHPDGGIQTVEGALEGRIAFKSAGENGFGFDPIFFVPSQNRTLAQLNREEKNLISHRAQALRRLCCLLGVNLS